MQILIPISGTSAFFPKEQYFFPKPLVEVAMRPMIEIVIKNFQTRIKSCKFIFVVDKQDIITCSLDQTLQLLTNYSSIVIEKQGPTSGALCSCLLAADVLDPDQPLIIANSDQAIDYDLQTPIQHFIESNFNAGVITFESVHPRWSYVVPDQNNNVVQAFEKKVASRHAIAGFYYYDKAAGFLDAARKVLLNDSHQQGVFYISSSLNEIILDGGKVGFFKIPAHAYHSFYSPSKIHEFESLPEASSFLGTLAHDNDINLVIPAAGNGSRFAKNKWKKPKPFIDLNGSTLLENVIHNLKLKNSSITVLLRKDHFSAYPKEVNNIKSKVSNISIVDNLTEGTASTVLLARKFFNNNNPLVIANSDQIVDFNFQEFVDDFFERDLDGSILVFKDIHKDPKWSFVKLDSHGMALEVAEKSPISDLATVGIYMFKNGNYFSEAAIDMILANDRVNNEFYTCPVYNYMIKKGLKVGVYEIPQSSVHGLGIPEDLNNYIDKFGLQKSSDAPS